MTMVRDGAGNGHSAKVDGNNRLHTQAVTSSGEEKGAIDGDAYNINTGEVTLTASAISPLIYFKNDETQDFFIEAVAVGIGSATTSDIGEVTLIRNPTGGDLISDGTAVSINQNRNFGSSRTLASTTLAYKGKSGGTISGGNDVALFYQGSSGRLFATVKFLIPKGSSIAVKIDPKISSGNSKAYCAIIGYLLNKESKD